MLDNRINSYKEGPDENGRFGNFGGRFVSETLMPLILSLEKEYEKAKNDNNFWKEMEFFLKDYVGRPSPLYFSERLTKHFGGAKIYLKRDELNHTGAHKINNVLGQILLAKRMGKKKDYCRNWSWTTWSCDSNSLCPFWFKMYCFYG